MRLVEKTVFKEEIQLQERINDWMKLNITDQVRWWRHYWESQSLHPKTTSKTASHIESSVATPSVTGLFSRQLPRKCPNISRLLIAKAVLSTWLVCSCLALSKSVLLTVLRLPKGLCPIVLYILVQKIYLPIAVTRFLFLTFFPAVL